MDSTSVTADVDAQVSNPSGNLSNSHLPVGIDIKLWCQAFIPTLFQYFACQLNPWAIPPRQIIPIMQIMWDAFLDEIPQEITATGMIYWLVSNSNICPTEYHTFSIQAIQCVSVSWCSPIRSMVIMVLITFFNSDMELSTNKDRWEWHMVSQ